MLAVTRTTGQTTGIALLGALWASRVFFYAGEVLPEGATGASPAAQAAGLQDALLSIVILIGVALLLAVWALIQERRQRADEILKAPVTQ